MKKKFVLIFSLLSVLLVGCGSKSQLTRVKQSEHEADLLAKVGATLFEFQIKLSDEINSESVVILNVDKYEYGKPIETVIHGEVGKGFEDDIKLSWGINKIGIDKEKFVLNISSGQYDNLIKIPKGETLSHFHAFDSIPTIEKDIDYHLAASLFSDGYAHNFPKTYIEGALIDNLDQYKLAYVLTLKVTDDWSSDNSGGAI